MRKTNIFKKTFIIIVSIIVPLLFTIVCATWYMISEEAVKPIYNPNSAFYIYLNDQKTPYNGGGQLPVPMLNGVRNDDIMDLSDLAIRYKYRKDGDSTSDYSKEMEKPVDAGTYYILFWSINDQAGEDYVSSEVKFTITPAPVKIEYNGGEDIEQMLYSPYIYETFDETQFTVKGCDGLLAGTLTINQTETIKNTNGDVNKGSGTQNGHQLVLNFTFVPDDTDAKNNYLENHDSYIFLVPLISVCKYNNKYFSRIENALTVANESNSGTVTIVINSDSNNNQVPTYPIIYSNCTIQTGVTLYLNYSNKDTYKQNDNDSNHKSTVSSSGSPSDLDNIPNIVTINNGVTLTNYGKLAIGGKIAAGSTGTRNCHTSTDYSILRLRSSATINNSGTIDCMGYIYESCDDVNCDANPYSGKTCDKCTNNGSIINMNKSSILYIPFIVRDMPNGAVLSAMNNRINDERFDSTLSPFNQFGFENISVKTKFSYGAKVHGYFNVIVANNLRYVFHLCVLSNDNKDFVCLVTEKQSSLDFKFTHKNELMDLDFYGDVNINSWVIVVEMFGSLGATTLNSADSFVPVSWQYDISFNQYNLVPAEVNINQRIKIMPGGKVTINKGVTCESSTLLVYDNSFEDNNELSKAKYPLGKGDGTLIVNGTLNVQNIGGRVYTTSNTARINVTISSSASTEEALTGDVDSFIPSENSISDVNTVTQTLSLHTNNSVENNTYTSVGNYGSTSNGYDDSYYLENDTTFYYWYPIVNYAISFNVGKSQQPIEPYNLTVVQYNNGYVRFEKKYLPSDEYMQTYINLHYKGHNLLYWYILDVDENGNENELTSLDNGGLIGHQFNGDIEIHAKWETITYNITYKHGYYSDNQLDISAFENIKVTNPSPKYTKDEKFDLVAAIPSITTEGINYKFAGWYYDEKCTTQLFNLDNYAEDITIYGKWESAEQIKFYINYYIYYDNKIEHRKPDFNSIASVNTEVGKAIISQYDNNNTSVKQYIDGWYTDANLETKIYDSNNQSEVLAKVIENAKAEFGKGETEYSVYINIKDKYYISYEDNINNISKTEYYPQGKPIELLTDSGNEENSNKDYLSRWRDSSFNIYTPGNDYTLSSNINLTLGRYYKVTVTVKNATPTLTCKLNKSDNSNYRGIIQSDSVADTLKFTSSGSCYVLNGCYIGIAPGYKYTDDKDINNCLINEVSTLDFTVKSNTNDIVISSEDGGCYSADTVIKTMNGDKLIKNVLSSDLILSFNHITGEYEYVPIAALIHHGDDRFTIMNLIFDDGSHIELIGRHGLFNITLNEYSHFDTNNCFDYIGHEFIKYDEGVNENVKLIDIEIYEKETGSYTLITSENLNCVANNLLNVSSGMFGLYNIFEYDENHMYDKDKFNQDIEKYGLYDYSVFKPYVDEKTFIDFGGKFFAVSIGKGYMEFESVLGYIIWLDDMIKTGEAITS